MSDVIDADREERPVRSPDADDLRFSLRDLLIYILADVIKKMPVLFIVL
mgnify:CR=1|jgi:hypothetical protein